MPCDFSHLIGNSQVKETLSHFVAHQKVPQVLLFHGPRGVGKGLFALRLAASLLNSSKFPHPDLHVLYPDPESDQHPIATVRQMIQEVALPPFEAVLKIFILHDIEKMLPTSSNALLKTLEEPPSDTHFILLTSHPLRLLPTLLSRSSKIPFYPVSDEELTQFLLEKHHAPHAKKIALLSEGSVGEALARLSSPSSSLSVENFFRVSRYVELYQALQSLPDDLSPLETDRFFEELLFYIREHEPLRLEEALPLLLECRTALVHHLKLKTVIESFFITFLKLL